MTVAWQPDMVQIVHEFESPLFNKGMAMVQHGCSSVGTPSPLMAEALYEAWADAFLDLLSNQAQFTRTRVLLEDVGFEFVGARQGGNSSINPAPQVTLLLNAQVPVRSPRARSRMYPPLVLADGDFLESGQIRTSVLEGRQLRINQYHEQLLDDGVQPRVVQNVEGISQALTPWPVITGWTVNPRIATQRRRLR